MVSHPTTAAILRSLTSFSFLTTAVAAKKHFWQKKAMNFHKVRLTHSLFLRNRHLRIIQGLQIFIQSSAKKRIGSIGNKILSLQNVQYICNQMWTGKLYSIETALYWSLLYLETLKNSMLKVSFTTDLFRGIMSGKCHKFKFLHVYSTKYFCCLSRVTYMLQITGVCISAG